MSSISAVCETHGGWGRIYQACYSRIRTGLVFETDEAKATALARQRPTWRVYESDCEASLRAGVGADLPIDLLDLDPYGAPWGILEAFFGSERERGKRLAMVVNDELRHKLITGSGHEVKALREYTLKVGSARLYDDYLEICQDKLAKLAASRDYKLRSWAGYYTGAGRSMTHYAAVFERTGKARRS